MNSGYLQMIKIVLIAIVPVLDIMAQDTIMSTSKVQAGYYKDQNGQESIITKLLVKKDRYEPHANAEIQIYAVADTANVLLNKVITNDKGEAIYFLEDKDKVYADSTGQLAFLVEYEGNTMVSGDEKDLQVKPAQLKVSFFQEDTSKFISVEAFENGIDNSITPIANVEIALYIKGTFSYLELAKDVTGEDGRLVVPFPVQMPGDTLGIITIAAKIEDHDVYGNVEAWGDINWAKPVALAIEARRGLGDTDAPLWMVYTLIVLLSAVWFHYAYVIFLVIKIKLAKHENQF